MHFALQSRLIESITTFQEILNCSWLPNRTTVPCTKIILPCLLALCQFQSGRKSKFKVTQSKNYQMSIINRNLWSINHSLSTHHDQWCGQIYPYKCPVQNYLDFVNLWRIRHSESHKLLFYDQEIEEWFAVFTPLA